MVSNETPNAGMDDAEIIQTGKRFAYGHWLQPIINANDEGSAEATIQSRDTVESQQRLHSQRRGRGRPRVTNLRDTSAIEKRRAQVREAQRTYQKRKDGAIALDKKRVDDLLKVLSDLSSDIESLLTTASSAGAMRRDDVVSKQIQQLWSSYNSAINMPCVLPELRGLQAKNTQRMVNDQSENTCPTVASNETSTSAPPCTNSESIRKETLPSFDPSGMSFELVRFEETTVMQPFQRTSSTNKYLAGRTIFDIVKERQAAMKEADKIAPENGA